MSEYCTCATSDICQVHDEIESLRKDAERLNREWQRECADGDAVLQALGLDPQDYRTDGGSLNLGKIRDRLLALDPTQCMLRGSILPSQSTCNHFPGQVKCEWCSHNVVKT